MGFDINRFKSRLPNEIICCICFGVLDQPTEVIECGHMFCSHCIEKWIDEPYYNTPTCPVCRRDISRDDIRHAPPSVQTYIDRLRVKCDFTEYGCIADVRFGEFAHHRAKCPLNPLRPVECHRGCGVRLPPNEMLKHRCELDMCQDAIEWEAIWEYVRAEMRKRHFERCQRRRHGIMADSMKKIMTFFTQWMADPRVQAGNKAIS